FLDSASFDFMMRSLSKSDSCPMNVLLTGASGLIGSALVRALADGGHRVVRLSRSPTPASTGSATWNPAAGQIDLSQAGSLEAVIHLAGEPIGRRWTADRKLRMRESRVAGTRVVSEAVARLPQVPRVLVCASGTGFYGDR